MRNVPWTHGTHIYMNIGKAPQQGTSSVYGNCPKILFTRLSNKMTYANSADLDHQVFHGVNV